jgi:fluoride exporter
MKGTLLLMVGIGGALGSMARYLIAGWVQPAYCTGFPYGILIVNITGGFLMGLFTEAMALKFHVSPEVRAFLTTGILGGYTTFSTFSLEAGMLIERQAYTQAVFYITGSALLSVAALFAGFWLMRAVYA